MKEPSCRSGSVSVDGAILRYVVEGSGIPTLVIGSAIYYPRTFSLQLRQSLRLAFVDARHFAEIDTAHSLDSITLDTYTADIERVRAEVGFERIVIVGHSHHGNLALEYSKRYPERVTHVVLIGSPPCNVEKTIKAGEEYWAGHASEPRKTALQKNWMELSPDRLDAMPLQDAFVARYTADGPRHWCDPNYNAAPLWAGMQVSMDVIQVFRNFFAEYELSWNPTTMRAPVLVVMGRYDYVVPHILWQAVLPKLHNVTFHLFERSGHTPQLEEPGLFNQVLLEWIRERSAVASEAAPART